MDGDEDAITWTYQDLKNAVAYTANHINPSIQHHDRVVLLFEPGLAFLASYLATVGSGAIAVPCHPPMGTRQVQRFLSMLQDCKPKIILYSRFIRESNAQLAQFTAMAAQMGIKLVEVDVPDQPEEQNWDRPQQALNDTAMLQYTSASTGKPKGVMVSQHNLVKNCEAIYKWLAPHPPRKGCIWLPPYHDMGLLGGIMQPLYAGFPLVFMSPMHFIQRPLRWLKAISDHRLTTTGAPNFAFQLCVDGITDEELKEANLDLSCAREIFSGSEPINPNTISAFYQRFREHGLPSTSLNPCYGLAEATLFVSGKKADTVVASQPFARDDLDRWQVTPSLEGRTLVSCGEAGNELDIRIVDPDTAQPAAIDDVGEIWIAGPSIAQGYWRNDQLTETAFHNRLPGSEASYYRTGDLGFMLDGELYVTGRLKEVIIVRGRNLYPQDIERCVLASSSLLDGRSLAAAFAISGDDTEELGVLVEVRQPVTPEQVEEIQTVTSAAIRAEFQVEPVVVHVGPRKTVLRTTSGKIQRLACAHAYHKGKLPDFPQNSPVHKAKAGERVPA